MKYFSYDPTYKYGFNLHKTEKDGTFLEIRVLFKKNSVNKNEMDISVESPYCDKNLTRFAFAQMMNVTKAVTQTANAKHEVIKND